MGQGGERLRGVNLVSRGAGLETDGIGIWLQVEVLRFAQDDSSFSLGRVHWDEMSEV